MQGQANHFYRLAKERMPYSTQRYVSGCERLYRILDGVLADRDYFVGPGRRKYTIADIANFSWINVVYLSGVELKKFPNLWNWCEWINAREAVQKGMSVPQAGGLDNVSWLRQLETGSDEVKRRRLIYGACWPSTTFKERRRRLACCKREMIAKCPYIDPFEDPSHFRGSAFYALFFQYNNS